MSLRTLNLLSVLVAILYTVGQVAMWHAALPEDDGVRQIAIFCTGLLGGSVIVLWWANARERWVG